MAGNLAAQDLRLESKVENPLMYLARQAAAEGEGDVLSALDDEAFLSLWGIGPLDQRDVKEVEAGSGVLRTLQRLLSRSSHHSELALLGLLPRRESADLPLLVVHLELREEGAALMQKLLGAGGLVRPGRTLLGQKLYSLRSGVDEVGVPVAPGAKIELALVGRHLVVSNHGASMQQVLDPGTRAHSSSLLQNARYRELRQQLGVKPGALLFYADWAGLGTRITRVFGSDGDALFAWSGMGAPQRLMLTSQLEKDGIATTVLLDHAGRVSGTSASEPKAEKQPKPVGEASGRASGKASAGEWSPDGWLDLVQPTRPSGLLSGLPRGGLFGMAVTMDPEKFLSTGPGPRMRSLQAAIFGGCSRMGLDLRRQVVRRLGRSAGAQFLFVEGKGGGLRLACSFKAKSRKAARDLFEDCHKTFAKRFGVRLVKNDAGLEELQVLGFRPIRPHCQPAFILGVFQDSVVLAFEEGVLSQVTRDARSVSRQARGRRDQALMSRLQKLGASRQKVDGIFYFDLGLLVRRLSSGTQDGIKASSSGTGLLGMHGGYFSHQENLIRMEVFTQL